VSRAEEAPAPAAREIGRGLGAYSEWLGYGHAERAEKWLARLDLNRPELEAFRAAPASLDAPYAAGAARVVPAEGLYALDARPARDAEAARLRAKADRGHAFTFVPDKVAAGIPVAVKDLMPVAGMPLTGGSRAIGADVAKADAEVVARLKRAGYAVIGLTNLHEFAYGITSANPHFGAVVNPAAPDRIPGGSSGGSAAAVAAGVVRFAIGTDTAGSIRVPAACCGIVGFKPSYDAVPRTGVLDLGSSLDHVGPMTVNVEESAAMFAAMLAMDAVPRWAIDNVREVRVARLRGYFEEPIDAEVRAALDAASKALHDDGASIGDHAIPGMDLAAAVQLNILCAEAGAVHAQRIAERGGDYGEDVRVRVEMAHFIPGHWYVKAQRLRTGIVRNIEATFEDADVMLCATLRTPAPKVGAAHVRMGDRDYPLHTAVTQLTMPFNLSGLPAVSVPWCRSRDGVPICLQVVAARGQDWRALAVAHRLQALAPWKGSAA
jgi:aspartyl-tRNA(Asn)/glutamyl-tRNA(Gln) amidotransferase subunit A